MSKLAVDGGAPVRREELPSPLRHDVAKECAAFTRRFGERHSVSLSRGQSNMALRKAACRLIGVAHCMPVTSGTAAVHTALAAMGIGPGDEVITSPCSDYGTIAGIIDLDATVVFADLAPDAITIGAREIAPHITQRTKAIIVVHNGGIPADMGPIMRLARQRGLPVIEDCAQAILATYDGRRAGAIGDLGCFSLNESKHVSCGEGGLVMCKTAEDALDAELFADKTYDRVGTGRSPFAPALNYRLSELASTFALTQLRRARGIVSRRRRLAEALNRGLAAIDGVRPLRTPKKASPAVWFYAFWVDEAIAATLGAARLAEMLRAEGIAAGVPPQPNILQWEIFRTLNRRPNAFRTYRPVGLKPGRYRLKDYPNAERLATEAVRLPLNESWGPREIRDVLKALKKITRTVRD